MRVIIFNHCYITILHLHTKYIYGFYLWCCVCRQSCCHLFWLLLGECRCMSICVCVCARVFVCSLNLWRLILVQLHVPNLVFLSCCCCCSFAQIKNVRTNFAAAAFERRHSSFRWTVLTFEAFLSLSFAISFRVHKKIYIHSKPTRIEVCKMRRRKEREKHSTKTCGFFYLAFSIVLFTYVCLFSLRFSLFVLLF